MKKRYIIEYLQREIESAAPGQDTSFYEAMLDILRNLRSDEWGLVLDAVFYNTELKNRIGGPKGLYSTVSKFVFGGDGGLMLEVLKDTKASEPFGIRDLCHGYKLSFRKLSSGKDIAIIDDPVGRAIKVGREDQALDMIREFYEKRLPSAEQIALGGQGELLDATIKLYNSILYSIESMRKGGELN